MLVPIIVVLGILCILGPLVWPVIGVLLLIGAGLAIFTGIICVIGLIQQTFFPAPAPKAWDGVSTPTEDQVAEAKRYLKDVEDRKKKLEAEYAITRKCSRSFPG